MAILKLFPTIAYKEQIKIPDSVIAAYKEEKLLRNGHNNGWMSRVGKHKDEKYAPLISIIDEHVDKYLKYLNLPHRVKCCGAWINMHSDKDWAQEHYHQNSMISGIVYLEAPEGSAPIKFHANQMMTHMFGPFFDHSGLYTVPLPVETGTLLLFPSTLLHSVPMNTKQVSRYSFAFDYMVHGKIDTFLNTTEVSI